MKGSEEVSGTVLTPSDLSAPPAHRCRSPRPPARQPLPARVQRRARRRILDRRGLDPVRAGAPRPPAARAEADRAGHGRQGGVVPGEKYAYSFTEEGANGQRIVGHSGGFPGINSQLDIYIYSGLGYDVAVMSNYDPPAAMLVAGKVRSSFAGREPRRLQVFPRRRRIGVEVRERLDRFCCDRGLGRDQRRSEANYELA